MQRHTIAEV